MANFCIKNKFFELEINLTIALTFLNNFISSKIFKLNWKNKLITNYGSKINFHSCKY